jgi:hypothetical protein
MAQNTSICYACGRRAPEVLCKECETITTASVARRPISNGRKLETVRQAHFLRCSADSHYPTDWSAVK